MAILQYTVFRDMQEVPLGDILQEGVIDIGKKSLQGSEIAGVLPNRQRVRIAVDIKCWVTWGKSPTAAPDTGGRMMGPDVQAVEYFDIAVGHKIAVIQRK